MDWLGTRVSPVSMQALQRSLNAELWSAFHTEFVQRTNFNQWGAAQALRDVTGALIPVGNFYFIKKY
jgi:hypothetical protein